MDLFRTVHAGSASHHRSGLVFASHHRSGFVANRQLLTGSLVSIAGFDLAMPAGWLACSAAVTVTRL